jgi:broad specificity phosphatase PhoE
MAVTIKSQSANPRKNVLFFLLSDMGRYIVYSLPPIQIYSTQCQSASNVDQSICDENDPLTEVGKRQAERLGNDWKDVHIDGLYSSTLDRAYDTACQIRTQNPASPEVIKSPLLVERKMGQEVIELGRAGHSESAGILYTGIGRYQSGPTPRGYRPPRGGESPNDVAERAKVSLVRLLTIHGVDLEEPPKEFVDKVTIDSPNILPEGIPHVVLVSHNVFLSELYETMLGWNTYYRMTDIDYSNADW